MQPLSRDGLWLCYDYFSNEGYGFSYGNMEPQQGATGSEEGKRGQGVTRSGSLTLPIRNGLNTR
ncbi:hypothetical protein Lalb_Chr01g0012861 [Lupinus albus]|uniref:Uncharacterized protein n=1 Tax=Lupinus albus TaxID=3870 RepID=A0A6A4R5M5_LUPAL|nr:hypothetical protein Lalb_Chr01g0012861 [Lupinus albus]